MRKDLERLIGEYLDEHPGAVIALRRDLLGQLEVSRADLADEAGVPHTHADTLAGGLRDLWGFRADGPGGMARKDGVQRGFAAAPEDQA